MFEWLGLTYELVKDIKKSLDWKEVDKTVDREWLEKSGFMAELEAQGVKLGWVKPERIASMALDGWGIVYELDQANRTRHKLVLYDGLTLVGQQA